MLTIALTSARPTSQAEDDPYSQLKLISEHVQFDEIPTKVIHVIKTVAIKIPVVYPVEVR